MSKKKTSNDFKKNATNFDGWFEQITTPLKLAAFEHGGLLPVVKGHEGW